MSRGFAIQNVAAELRIRLRDMLEWYRSDCCMYPWITKMVYDWMETHQAVIIPFEKRVNIMLLEDKVRHLEARIAHQISQPPLLLEASAYHNQQLLNFAEYPNHQHQHQGIHHDHQQHEGHYLHHKQQHHQGFDQEQQHQHEGHHLQLQQQDVVMEGGSNDAFKFGSQESAFQPYVHLAPQTQLSNQPPEEHGLCKPATEGEQQDVTKEWLTQVEPDRTCYRVPPVDSSSTRAFHNLVAHVVCRPQPLVHFPPQEQHYVDGPPPVYNEEQLHASMLYAPPPPPP